MGPAAREQITVAIFIPIKSAADFAATSRRLLPIGLCIDPYYSWASTCMASEIERSNLFRGQGVVSISNRRLLVTTHLSLHVFTQGTINACLITLVGRRVRLEPDDNVGVEAKRYLLFDGSIKEAARGA
jgi:hypothetical protein